jgi:hypothetical protein
VLSTQTVDLHAGWNWFSTGVQPADPAVQPALSSIAGRYDYLLGETGTYSPSGEPFLNSLHSLEAGRGYMIRMKEAASLVFTGSAVSPSTPIELSEGWHWIGYLGAGSAALPDALSSISGSYDYVVGEDGTYSPTGLPFLNTLSVLEQGRGYLIRMNRPASLRFSP